MVNFQLILKIKIKKGKYGGDKEIDLNRITGKITIPYPILSNKDM